MQTNEAVSFNVCDSMLRDFSLELGKGLDDTGTLLDEIKALMQYKSYANGVETVVNMFAQLEESTEDYAKLCSQSELSGIISDYQAGRTLLQNDASLANGFFDSVYGVGAEELKQGVLDAAVYSDAIGTLLVSNAIKIYAQGIFIYGEISYDVLSDANALIEIQNKAREKVGKLKEKDNAEDFGELIEEIENKVLDEDFYGVYASAYGNYLRFESSKNNYNRFLLSIQKNESINNDILQNTIESIASSYKNYEKIDMTLKETPAVLGDCIDYGNEAKREKLAGEFFALCKNEIPDGVYKELPSRREKEESKVKSLYEDSDEACEVIKNAGKSIADGFLLNDYIKTYFKTAADVKNMRDHYLTAEIEYIIGGHQKDETNIREAYFEILAIRTALNATHILCDSDKMDLVKSAGRAAATATEGFGAEIYMTIIIIGWSTAEAINDMSMLQNGEAVPLVKKKSDWKLSIEGLSEEDNGKNLTGMKYKDYLCLLLAVLPNETKLKRIQDLVELNIYKKTNTYRKMSEMYSMAGITA